MEAGDRTYGRKPGNAMAPPARHAQVTRRAGHTAALPEIQVRPISEERQRLFPAAARKGRQEIAGYCKPGHDDLSSLHQRLSLYGWPLQCSLRYCCALPYASQGTYFPYTRKGLA